MARSNQEVVEVDGRGREIPSSLGVAQRVSHRQENPVDEFPVWVPKTASQGGLDSLPGSRSKLWTHFAFMERRMPMTTYDQGEPSRWRIEARLFCRRDAMALLARFRESMKSYRDKNIVGKDELFVCNVIRSYRAEPYFGSYGMLLPRPSRS